MATSTYGTPYVQGSDLVSAYPTVSSSLATRVDEVSYKGNGLNAQTGTTYQLVAGDAGKTITLSNASPVAVTLPQDSTADLPDGAVVTFYNLGAGAVTISQGTGATLQGGSITLAQYAVTSVIKLSANTYGKFDGGEPSGMTLISPSSISFTGTSATSTAGTTSFSAVTVLTINGLFSADYQSYMLVMAYTSTVAGNLTLRMTAAGTPHTGATSYTRQRLVVDSTTVTAQRGSDNYWYVSANGTTTKNLTIAYLTDPFAASRTIISARAMDSSSGATLFDTGGNHDQAVSYDGLQFNQLASGNVTGTIRCYGLRGA